MSKDSSKKDLHPGRKKTTGWGPIAAIIVTVCTFFGAQLITGLLISLYGDVRGLSGAQLQSLIDSSASWRFGLNLLIQANLLVLVWLFLRSRSISWLDLGLKRPKPSHILYAVPIFILYLLSLFIALTVIDKFIPGIDLEQKQQIGFSTAAHGKDLVLIFLSLVMLTPIIEEIIMRGFLYGGLKNGMSKLRAALITSVIFGIPHLQLDSGEKPLWTAAIGTFILSMFLVWLRERTGNIWAGIAVHMFKNGLAFISLFILHAS